MAGFSAAIALGGLALSGYGAYTQYQGQKQAASAQKQQEAIRRRQMNAEANRQRRAAIREATLARGSAVNIAAGALGGEITGSSVIEGINAGTFGRAAYNVGQTNVSQTLGGEMFAAKAAESSAMSTAAMGSGLSSLGGMLMSNNTRLADLFSIRAAPPSQFTTTVQPNQNYVPYK